MFNTLLLFSLFGIALGFFGVLYEGIVIGPKFLDHSPQRLLFWKEFYNTIDPRVYYLPINPLSTLALAILFLIPKKKKTLKKQLGFALLFQLLSFAITIYIVTQLNLKLCFLDIEKYAAVIPSKTVLFNVLSICRIVLTAVALRAVFKACLESLLNSEVAASMQTNR